MAESVLRLRVDNKEFDDGVKNATKGLKSLINSIYEMSGKFRDATPSQIAYVRAMGQMETQSTSARGKLSELTKAYKELQYHMQQASSGQRNTELFQVMQKSAQDLKVRMQEARQEVERLDKSTKGMDASSVEDLAKKFITLQAAIGAAKAAFNIAKEAYTSNEEGLDNLNRAIEGAKAGYNQFLIVLNNGSWSNFLTNLNEAIKGAETLYNKLDALGSMKANNSAIIAMKQSTLQALRVELQKAEKGGDKAAIANIKDKIATVQKELSSLQREQVKAGKDAGMEAVKQAIKQQGEGNISDGMAAVLAHRMVNEGDTFVREMEAEYNRLRKKYTQTTISQGVSTYGQQSVVDTEVRVQDMTKEERALYEKAKAVYQSETRAQEGIAMFAQAVQEEAAISTQEFKTGRWGNSVSGGSTKKGKQKATADVLGGNRMSPSDMFSDKLRGQFLRQQQELQKMFAENVNKEMGEMLTGANVGKMVSDIQAQIQQSPIGTEFYNKLTEKLADAQNLQMLLQEAIKAGLDVTQFESIYNKLLGNEAIENADWVEIEGLINEKLESLKLKPIKLSFDANGKASKEQVKDAKETSNAWKDATQSVIGLGNAMNAIEDPTAKAFGTVLEAIAGVAAGFGQASKGPFSSPWEYVAFIASGMASMVAAITTIKSVTGHKAGGGFVSGNPTGGAWGTDTVPIMATAGELVLNQSQQTALANNLYNNANERVSAQGLGVRVRGEDMFTCLDNYTKRTNKRLRQ